MSLMCATMTYLNKNRRGLKLSLSDFTYYAGSLLDELFLKPEFTLKVPVKAAPLTKNYQAVGSAFDYAFRLLISKLNLNLINDFPLTAKDGVKGDKRRDYLLRSLKKSVSSSLVEILRFLACLPIV